ncbi:MAG: sulfotransferase family 2 domain-containing protein [Flavobacteriales bacterium]|nr:sulfotransferase family 2 domain-containing protein [Flavobacteriales bacterium]
MENKNIFIHIPKTGGTTINTAMHNVYWQTEPDFNYRHISLKDKVSTSEDIFNPNNFERYHDYNIFMMLREPVDRIVSEYYFLRERKEYIKLLNKPPVDFDDYYKKPQTHNYMVGFLIGKRIYDTKPTTRNDLDNVIEAIEKLPIHVGIFEYFQQSMGYFKDKTSIEWSKNLPAKRMTFNRPSIKDLSDSTKQEILELNNLDKELYDYCLTNFESIKPSYDSYKINFKLSKYDHIYPYMSKTCLFEFCLENKHYIKQNFLFFKDLTFHLIKDLAINDGERLVTMWNNTIIKSIEQSFPDSDFHFEVKKAHAESVDNPLNQLINMAEAINNYFKQNQKNGKKFYKAMKLDKKLITEPIVQKASFLSRLFGKK